MFNSKFLVKVRSWGKEECVTFIEFNELTPDLSDLGVDSVQVLTDLPISVLKSYIIRYVQSKSKDDLY